MWGILVRFQILIQKLTLWSAVSVLVIFKTYKQFWYSYWYLIIIVKAITLRLEDNCTSIIYFSIFKSFQSAEYSPLHVIPLLPVPLYSCLQAHSNTVSFTSLLGARPPYARKHVDTSDWVTFPYVEFEPHIRHHSVPTKNIITDNDPVIWLCTLESARMAPIKLHYNLR